MIQSTRNSTFIDRLYGAVCDVPDYPQPGIIFRDITPLLGDGKLFGAAMEAVAEPYRTEPITKIVSIESRGFILGAAVAKILGAGVVPIRKPGKLPRNAHRVEYQLEYGTDALEMHEDALTEADRVLVVDDVLATGGTAAAANQLVTQRGVQLAGFAFLIELDALNGRSKLDGVRVESVMHYPRK